MNTDLTGKTALVCGSSQGIGLACAAELASLGATVTLMARNADSLKQRVSELPTPTNQMHGYLVADYSNPETVRKAIEEAQALVDGDDYEALKAATEALSGTSYEMTEKLYAALDASALYTPHAQPGSRSLMNVTWTLGGAPQAEREALTARFVKEATTAGLDGLKGHRSVGGLRASIYNAFPEAGVDELIAFMREFERTA